MKDRIVIYSTGGVSSYLYDNLDFEKVDVVAYIDSFNYGKTLNGILVFNDNIISQLEFDYIVIACGAVSTVKKKLIKLGIPSEKIVSFVFDDSIVSEVLNNKLNIYVEKYLNCRKIERISSLKYKKMYASTMWYVDIDEAVEINDFVREQTLVLLAKEIKRKGIDLPIAELGVYKGDFSKRIGNAFEINDFYLFDTFEGFDKKDMLNDITFNKQSNTGYSFANTSINEVLSKIKNRQRCIVKKGYFPDSFDLEDNISFSFVSIDVDLYDPTLAGLELFYPRLCLGGYIMVHDYNNQIYGGTKNAVIEFCDKNNISYFPLADTFGSIVISK